MPAPELQRLVSEAQAEVSRQMAICNACRYCEGLCAVFPAMEMRTRFGPGEVDYLANLCHNCSACYYDCQYAPPHEFSINVPASMAVLREESYARYTWPSAAASLFERNGLKVAVTTALLLAAFLLAFVALAEPGALFASGADAGAFYRVMPHNAMLLVFGGAFCFSLFAIAAGVRRFWRAGERLPPMTLASFWQATSDSARLRYLHGGGMGCMVEGERPDTRRKRSHHLTFYGFLLCFAATSSATVLHYGFGLEAPYSWWSLPVVLGVLGGLGLIAGPLGLLRVRRDRDPSTSSGSAQGLDSAFLWMLILVSATGLALLALRSTSLMGIVLAVHLGFVLAFFLTMPYGKFVHGIFRFAALLRYAVEHRQAHGKP